MLVDRSHDDRRRHGNHQCIERTGHHAGPQPAEIRIGQHANDADDGGDLPVDGEHRRDDDRSALQIDEDLKQDAEDHRQRHNTGRHFRVCEAVFDEFGNRIALRHVPAQDARERDHRDYRKTVRHDEPEQPGQSPLVGHRRAHHHRHGPSPHRDDRADAKSEADFAIGDDEIMRIANERGLDRERQRQQKNAEPDHDREAEPRAQPIGERQYRFVHLRKPPRARKASIEGGDVAIARGKKSMQQTKIRDSQSGDLRSSE